MSKSPSIPWVVSYLVVSVFCFIIGAMGWVDHEDNPQPITMPLADYLHNRPVNRWVELEDCTILYSQGVAWKQTIGGNLLDVCVPVYPSGVSSGQVPLILRVDEQEVTSVTSRPDELHATIIGMVGTGLDSKLKAVARWTPADQCIVVNQNRTPSIGWAIGPCIVGLILLAYGAHGIRSIRRRPAQIEETEPSVLASFPDPMATLEQFRKLSDRQAEQVDPESSESSLAEPAHLS